MRLTCALLAALAGAAGAEPETFTATIEVGANGVPRIDATVGVPLDYRRLVGQGSDAAVVRVDEFDNPGRATGQAVAFQYDRIDAFRGELVVALPGRMAASEVRRFRAHFGAPSDTAFSKPEVTVDTIVNYQGQPSVRVRTPRATWLYHRPGAGFASLLDADGADWISYKPSGGADGKYRGIPNLIHPESDFHPGGENSTTRIVHAGPLRVRLHSRTNDGAWEGFWDIFPGHATFTLTKAPREYWLLYEGTPAGKLDIDRDFWLLSDGSRGSVSESFAKDLPRPEWIAFGDSSVNRVLFLAHHADDDELDQFYQMQGEMTVFGFGRQHRCCGKYLTEVPAVYSVGFVESRDFEVVKSAIAAVTASFEILVGTPAAAGPVTEPRPEPRRRPRGARSAVAY